MFCREVYVVRWDPVPMAISSNFQDPTVFFLNSGVLPKLIRQRWGEKGVECIPVKVVRNVSLGYSITRISPQESPEAKQMQELKIEFCSPLFFKPRSFIVPGLQTVVLWMKCHHDGVGTNPSLLVADWHTWRSMMPLLFRSNLTNKHASRFINNRNWRNKNTKNALSMLSQKKSLQGVGQPFFRNTCKDSSFVLEFEDETVKIPLESRVGKLEFHRNQAFSRFMENGSRRSFKAKHLQGFFHAFPYELLFGFVIFPTIFGQSWLVLVGVKSFFEWKKTTGTKTPRPRNLFRFWQMGVSKNRDTPKWMVYNGKPY